MGFGDYGHRRTFFKEEITANIKIGQGQERYIVIILLLVQFILEYFKNNKRLCTWARTSAREFAHYIFSKGCTFR